jgi:hypothetical protein
MWTHIYDMHSGGGTKEPPYEHIYIEAPEDEAISVFYSKFGHNPNRITCTCCGQDYSIYDGESLEQLTGYHRGCAYDRLAQEYLEEQSKSHSYNKYKTLDDYLASSDVLVVSAEDIENEGLSRTADVPHEGWTWQ